MPQTELSELLLNYFPENYTGTLVEVGAGEAYMLSRGYKLDKQIGQDKIFK
jgi:hypothetical protein